MSLRVSRTRVFVSAGVIGFAIALTLWGRHGAVSQAQATQYQKPADQAPAFAKEGSDNSKQVVAYIYDKVAITRQELGDYLIARCGTDDRVKNMVNRCIIEFEAKQRGIEVTAAEVEAEFNQTLRGLNVDQEKFVNTLLKPHNKSLYEWKEDVVREKLLLDKMCRERVTVTEEDYQHAFEAYYGPKAHCKMIMWPKSQRNIAVAVYPKIRDNEKEFDEVARHQASSQLASKAGEYAPFGRYSTGNEELEKEAFALKPGEVSQLLETQEGVVVIKCIAQIPASHDKTLDEVKAALTADIRKRKLDQVAIPAFFAELFQKAHPKIFTKDGTATEDLMSEVRRELKDTPPAGSH